MPQRVPGGAADQHRRHLPDPLRRDAARQRPAAGADRAEAARRRAQGGLQPGAALPQDELRQRARTVQLRAALRDLQRREYEVLRQQRAQPVLPANLLLDRRAQSATHPAGRFRRGLSGEVPREQDDLSLHRAPPESAHAYGAAPLPVPRRGGPAAPGGRDRPQRLHLAHHRLGQDPHQFQGQSAADAPPRRA